MGKVYNINTVYDLATNYVLLCAVAGWFAAQFLKFFIKLVVTKKPDWERLTGAGGMPSSHSAMVCALALAVAKTDGTRSPVFAIAFMFACVVIYDAVGVRRAAGEHAKALNSMKAEQAKSEEDFEEEVEELVEFKEKLGHTPLEVLGGALLGILIPTFVEYIFAFFAK